MTVQHRRRLFWILLLVLVLSSVLAWFTNQQRLSSTVNPMRLDQAASMSPTATSTVEPTVSSQAPLRPQVVPVFDAGSIRASLPEPSPKKPKLVPVPRPRPSRELVPDEAEHPVERNSEAQVEAQDVVPQDEEAQLAGGAAMPQPGDWPTLEASFSDIGFDAYLNVIERLGGRFFLLVHDGLGPEISLRDGRVFGPLVESGLAIERPHLVTDEAIKGRLETADLPEGARTESVVLLLSRWFDQVLWKEIEKAVVRHDQTLANIALIRASYLRTPAGIYLALRSATVREGGETLNLVRHIRLPI